MSNSAETSPPAVQTMMRYYSTPPPAGQPYALPVAGTERPNRTAVYRHWRLGDSEPIGTIDPAVRTLHDSFERSVRARPSARCLGWRPWDPSRQLWENRYDWLTYAQVAQRRTDLGAGIVELLESIGLPAAAGQQAVGLWSQNRPEWQLTDLALVSHSLYSVSLYETLGPDAIQYIINHAGIACVVCSLPHVAQLLRVAPRVPKLKLIISMDPLDSGEQPGLSKAAILTTLAAERGLRVISLDEVERIGAGAHRAPRPPNANDIATINYTSGTTGPPKGVVLTHSNAVAALSASLCSSEFHARDCHISYLPLAHIYGRMTDQLALAVGARTGYFHGDILGLVDDMKLLRPSALFSVPRLYNRISSGIRAQTVEATGLRGALSRRIIATKMASMAAAPGSAHNHHLVYDRIWTPKVLAAIGLQHCHSMISGSAQLDPDVHRFLRAACGNNFVQGFGMTETYSVGTVQFVGDFSLDNVGPPNLSVEICLESVPDLGYQVTDRPHPRGELLLRGPIVFGEYYRDEAETRRAVEPDGWFHSGDICEIDPLGRLRIVDRKKNLLKLAHGEYLSPERIENAYMAGTGIVSSAFVHGDSDKAALVAIFGIDPAGFVSFASPVLRDAAAAIGPLDPANVDGLRTAAQHPAVRRAFLRVLDDIARIHGFNNLQRVRTCHLDVDPFTVENELLTPTLKLKRQQAVKAFRKQIDSMYAEIEQAEGLKSKSKL